MKPFYQSFVTFLCVAQFVKKKKNEMPKFFIKRKMITFDHSVMLSKNLVFFDYMIEHYIVSCLNLRPNTNPEKIFLK